MKALILAGVLSFGALHAEDWALPSGTVYHDVAVVQSNLREVTITSKEGTQLLPLAKLPPELQKKFGYNPEAIAADQEKKNATASALATQQKSKAAAAELAKSAVGIKGEVLGIYREGVLVYHAATRSVVTGGGPFRSGTVRGVDSEEANYLLLGLPGNLAKGDTVSITAYDTGKVSSSITDSTGLRYAETYHIWQAIPTPSK